METIRRTRDIRRYCRNTSVHGRAAGRIRMALRAVRRARRQQVVCSRCAAVAGFLGVCRHDAASS